MDVDRFRKLVLEIVNPKKTRVFRGNKAVLRDYLVSMILQSDLKKALFSHGSGVPLDFHDV